MSHTRFYVAGEWSNPAGRHLVSTLRHAGQVVFHSDDLDEAYTWMRSHGPSAVELAGPREFVVRTRNRDVAGRARVETVALEESDVFVLIVPAPRSADALFGWALAQQLPTIVLHTGPTEPELMYSLADRVITDLNEFDDAIESIMEGRRSCAQS